MNKYIIEFLKQEGRVIIPDFGCLSMSDDGKVVFNTYIKFDDGKLSSYICEQTGTEAQDVINKISAWAREIQAQVNKGEDFELVGLGKFYKTGPDELDFKASTGESNDAAEKAKESQIEQSTNPIEPAAEDIKTETSDEPQSTTEKPEIEDAEKPESKHNKNIYIPPSTDETNTEPEKAASLDALLDKKKTDETIQQDEVKSVDEKAEISHPEETPAFEDRIAASTHEEPQALDSERENTPEPEKTSNKNADKEADKKDKKTKNAASKTSSEEVTVKRKRGVFFYINILLLLLIIGLSVFAYLYTDEISKWLGITTEKVLDEPKQEEEEIVAPEPEIEEILPETPSEDVPVEEIVEEPVQQVIIDPIPAVAASGNFHIIVGTFSVKENAERLVQKIRDAGYDGKILKSSAGGHTVSFHSYNTKDDASNNISKATEITGTSAYVLKQ